jgi:hypothetical protein
MTKKKIPQEYRDDFHKERIDENNQILKNISLIIAGIFLVYLLQYIFLRIIATNNIISIIFLSFLLFFQMLYFSGFMDPFQNT